jgi:hypothetical protein
MTAQGVNRMVRYPHHVEIMASADAGHVISCGEEMIAEPEEEIRQNRLYGMQAVAGFSSDNEIKLHGRVSPFLRMDHLETTHENIIKERPGSRQRKRSGAPL